MTAIDLLETGSRPDLGGELTQPLWLLLQAMKDVSNGRSPEMFKPNMKGKPGESAEIIRIQQMAAIAVQELLDDKIKLKEACRRVATALHGIKGIWTQHKSNPADTIEYWREMQMKPDVRHEYNGRVALWRSKWLEASGREGTPAERAELLITLLKDGKF